MNFHVAIFKKNVVNFKAALQQAGKCLKLVFKNPEFIEVEKTNHPWYSEDLLPVLNNFDYESLRELIIRSLEVGRVTIENKQDAPRKSKPGKGKNMIAEVSELNSSSAEISIGLSRRFFGSSVIYKLIKSFRPLKMKFVAKNGQAEVFSGVIEINKDSFPIEDNGALFHPLIENGANVYRLSKDIPNPEAVCNSETNRTTFFETLGGKYVQVRVELSNLQPQFILSGLIFPSEDFYFQIDADSSTILGSLVSLRSIFC